MKTVRRFPVFTSANVVDWQEQDLSELAPNQIRIEAILTGISAGTEGMWFNGSAAALRSGRKSYPYTPGYEFVGHVVGIGSDIINNPDNYSRFSKLSLGSRIFAFKPHGSLADLFEDEMWVELADDISNENSLGHALCCTCLHAIHRAAPSFGASSAVFGLGTLGFILIQILSSMQSSAITAVTTSKNKQEMALALGASAAISLDDLLNTETGTPLPDHAVLSDVIYECSGVTDVLQNTTLLAANQGQIIATGFYNDPVILDGEHLFAKELTVKSVRAAGAARPRNEYLRWPRTENLKLANQLITFGNVKMDQLMTHQVSPDNLQETYEMIRDRSEPFLQIAIKW